MNMDVEETIVQVGYCHMGGVSQNLDPNISTLYISESSGPISECILPYIISEQQYCSCGRIGSLGARRTWKVEDARTLYISEMSYFLSFRVYTSTHH